MSSQDLFSPNTNSDELYPSPLRHNPCLMKPVSALLLVTLSLLATFTALLSIPQYVVGIITGWFINRSNILIEFLYPMGIARWGHVLIMKLTQKKNVSSVKAHSRTMETRIELVPGVYIHPISQFTDNIAYAIITPSSESLEVLIVDVGDSDALHVELDMVAAFHYGDSPWKIHAVISTHKHHDHTAGNKTVKSKVIYGGVIENVPHATNTVKNGDFIPLPVEMSRLALMEVIAVPSHTRGSIILALRALDGSEECLFTGDALFSGGGGIPFEAEMLAVTKENPASKTYRSFIQPAAGGNSMERAFCEILARSVCPERTIVCPGHEYTFELLQRQFAGNVASGENVWGVDWTVNASLFKLPSYISFSPDVFFKTASHFFVASHKRTLPRQAGKLLTVPTTLERELDINAHFRCLRKRGSMLLKALAMWHKYLANDTTMPSTDAKNNDTVPILEAKSTVDYHEGATTNTKPDTHSTTTEDPQNENTTVKLKQIESPLSSTLTTTDIHREVFTTVYTTDLTSLISKLQSSQITPVDAANELKALSTALSTPLVTKRPIPHTLPSQKLIWMGTLNLAILASPPSAMTVSDAKQMNLPPPISKQKSDYILVSRKRLLTILHRLKLIPTTQLDGSSDLVLYIHKLWRAAHDLLDDLLAQTTTATAKPTARRDDISYYQSMENGTALKDDTPDTIELGLVKIALYGLGNFHMEKETRNAKFPFCVPCLCPPKVKLDVVRVVKKGVDGGVSGGAPTENTKILKRSSGELIRHSVESCPICRQVTGGCADNECILIERPVDKSIRIVKPPQMTTTATTTPIKEVERHSKDTSISGESVEVVEKETFDSEQQHIEIVEIAPSSTS